MSFGAQQVEKNQQYTPEEQQAILFKATQDAVEFLRERLARAGVEADGAMIHSHIFINDKLGVICAGAVATDCDYQWIAKVWGQEILDNVQSTITGMSAGDRIVHPGSDTQQ